MKGKTKSKAKKTARKIVSKPVKKKAGPKKVDEAAMMAQWQKAMTPAEGHSRLKPLVGSWHAKGVFTMGPGAPPETSDGTSEHRWVLGGRFLEQRYQSQLMGMPFEGLGFTGYDNVRGKYVGAWMDTFSTGIMPSVGVGKPKASGFDSVSECLEPSGKKVVFDCKIKMIDNDHHTWEMWSKGPNGKRYRAMLIEYTRK